MAIHISSLHPPSIASRPPAKAPVQSVHSDVFRTLFGSLASNRPSQRSPVQQATAPATTVTTANANPAGSAPVTSTPVKPPTSSDGTSLANLMAAASYAGVPYYDLPQIYNSGHGTYDPNWQQKMADALEARLQLVAGPGISKQVYDPNPANDRVPIDLMNTKQFTSSASEIQGLLNNMWGAIHAGDVNGYHAALQTVDAWYQSNGQQNYQTGLTDAQVAAFDPAKRALMTEMPNANASVAAAELAAITGQSSPMANLAEVAQAVKT